MYENELGLFQRSNEAIWTDEHMSKTLLDAHLDESNDAASRKPERRTNIIQWINKNINPNSKIIDLGCGPGLYDYELGRLGHCVLGVDFNNESINYAQKNKCIDDTIEYRYCNYLKDEINGKYNAAMMIFFDFGALITNEQKLLLKKIENFLEDDGIFIFDVYGKEEIGNINEKRNWFTSKGGDFWSEDPYICMEERKFFKNENALGTRYYLVNQSNGKIKEFIMWDQYYDENSIGKLMSENGFEIIEINKDLVKYNEENLLIIAKRKR
jgi:SAM-dependent methyltransferase